jgi:hypothetical protein
MAGEASQWYGMMGNILIGRGPDEPVKTPRCERLAKTCLCVTARRQALGPTGQGK